MDPCAACCNADVPAMLQIKHDAVSTSEISRPNPANIGPKDLLPVKVAAPRGMPKVKRQLQDCAQRPT